MTAIRHKYLNFTFYILLLLMFVCMVLAFSNRIVFQWFGIVPVILACVIVVLRTVIRFRKGRGIASQFLYCVLIPVLLIALIVLVGLISYFVNPREFQEELTSPSGNTIVIIEYNLASRPSVYIKKNAFFMTPVPMKEFIGGYNETIHFDIKWLSDTQISMTNYLGEEYTVDLFP